MSDVRRPDEPQTLVTVLKPFQPMVGNRLVGMVMIDITDGVEDAGKLDLWVDTSVRTRLSAGAQVYVCSRRIKAVV